MSDMAEGRESVVPTGENLEASGSATRIFSVPLVLLLGLLTPNLGPVFVGVTVGYIALAGLILHITFARISTERALIRARFIALSADLFALVLMMWVWSPDPAWITLALTPLGIISGTFRLANRGAYLAATVLSIAQLALIPVRGGSFESELTEAVLRVAAYWLIAVTLARLLGGLGTAVAIRERMLTRVAQVSAEPDSHVAGARTR